MHLISLNSLEVSQIEFIIDTSIQIKNNPQAYKSILQDKSLYMLFEKTSTRTALSFGLGFNELGGRYFMQKWQDSNFVVGAIADEIRYVARNVDIVLARLKHHDDIACMERYSPVPVINGCCDRYHPTQALADCLTVKELFGTYEKTMVYLGIWNNTFNSLAASFPRLGGRLIGVCPIINSDTLSEKEAHQIVDRESNLDLYTDITPNHLKKLIDEADLVYTDTWVDMEFFNHPEYSDLKEERINLMKPFSLTRDLLKDSHAAIMHDMPIHHGYEIEKDVVEANLDTILDQAENRRHTAKGIYAFLLEESF